MIPPVDPASHYSVVYSERVRISLRRLIVEAKALGRGQDILEAVKEIDERLHVFPQFGQPLYDLKSQKETVWIGVVAPLVARYVIDEDRRMVFVVIPFRPLRRSGI